MDDKQRLKILWEAALDRSLQGKVDLNPKNYLRELGNLSTRTGISKEEIATVTLEALDELVARFKKAVKEKIKVE
jgi:hypothetical protein